MTIFSLKAFGDHTALIDGDDGRVVAYGEIDLLSQEILSIIKNERSLVFLFCKNRVEEIIAYIALMNAGHVVCLLDAQMADSFKKQLVTIYSPSYIFEGIASNLWDNYKPISSPLKSLFIYQTQQQKKPYPLHPDLQLLFTTSGTTGNPKLIRLSKENIISNASSISEYLKINAQERAIASLPFHYSYGLSVLHTHLLTGASIVLTQNSIVQDPFWKIVRSYECTSLAGVPYTYKMLDRIGFEKLELPSLRVLTQAGGRLEKPLVLKFYEVMRKRDGLFFVMYGQTEATARIAYLPPHHLPEKAGAIGIAIPKGNLQFFKDDEMIQTPNEIGELVYRGPNVMMGYAANEEDLNKADELHGTLRTGDLGYFDEDSIFYITGRLKRISKVYGLRINLDDVEKELSSFGTIAVTTTDTHLCIHIENSSPEICEKCINHLVELYHLHPTTFKCRSIEQLPRTTSGKIDYQQL